MLPIIAVKYPCFNYLHRQSMLMNLTNDLLSQAELLDQNQNEVLSWQIHGEERLNRRPDSDRWSLYEIIDHLDKVNRSYFDQLAEITLGNGRSLNGLGLWWGNKLGKFILNGVQPSNTRKVKTFPVWTPTAITYQDVVFSNFVESQQKMIGYVKSSGEAVARDTRIVSPANKYLYYPLGIAFQIIAVHQLRHIQQGKQVLQFFHDEIEP